MCHFLTLSYYIIHSMKVLRNGNMYKKASWIKVNLKKIYCLIICGILVFFDVLFMLNNLCIM